MSFGVSPVNYSDVNVKSFLKIISIIIRMKSSFKITLKPTNENKINFVFSHILNGICSLFRWLFEALHNKHNKYKNLAISIEIQGQRLYPRLFVSEVPLY